MQDQLVAATFPTALGRPEASGTSTRCAQCHLRPRLGALSRCGDCVRAAAEADRQTRQVAESRLAGRKRAQEAETRATSEHQAELEAAATTILHDPVAIAALEAAGADLLRPINEDRRGYLKRLLANEVDR